MLQARPPAAAAPPCRRRLSPPALRLAPRAAPIGRGWRCAAASPAGAEPSGIASSDGGGGVGVGGQRRRHVFIFGLGYTTLALASALHRQGWRVSGTARAVDADRAAPLLARGWGLHAFDPARGVRLSAAGAAELAAASHVLSSVPPLALPLYDPALAAQLAALRGRAAAAPAAAPASPSAAAAAGAAPAAAAGAAAAPLAWVGYLSSTSVYGDHGGGWVDEGSEARPGGAKGLLRLEAERAWRGLGEPPAALPVHVFRLGGIYGPRRSVLDGLAAGAAPPSATQRRRERQRFTSRVHVADIVAALAASMAAPAPRGGVYNVADDSPAPRAEVVAFARALAGLPAEPAEPEADGGGSGEAAGAASPSGRSGRGGGATEEKRVRAGRVRDELRVALAFPTYREGVAAIHAGDIAPFFPEDLAYLGYGGPEGGGGGREGGGGGE